MDSNLKLFVWEGVLEDWTSGIVCVLAHDLEEAYRLVEEEDRLAIGEISHSS